MDIKMRMSASRWPVRPALHADIIASTHATHTCSPEDTRIQVDQGDVRLLALW